MKEVLWLAVVVLVVVLLSACFLGLLPEPVLRIFELVP